MCELVLFAGTSEGREIAAYCAERQLPTTVCVATEYGKLLLPESPWLRVVSGRQTAEQMAELLEQSGCRAAVDATHPYAQAVSENLRAACRRAQKRYVRIVREKSELTGCTLCGTAAEAVAFLNGHLGPFLLTTGSKLLPEFTSVAGFAGRCALRILPTGVEQAVALGYDPARIISGQGPFTLEENLRHLRRFGAKVLVTKESGAAGGFPEKIAAAKAVGAVPLVLTRPTDEDGISVAELLKELEGWR